MATQSVRSVDGPQQYAELFQHIDDTIIALNLLSVEEESKRYSNLSELPHYKRADDGLQRITSFAVEHFTQALSWNLNGISGTFQYSYYDGSKRSLITAAVQSLIKLKTDLQGKIEPKIESKGLMERVASLEDQIHHLAERVRELEESTPSERKRKKEDDEESKAADKSKQATGEASSSTAPRRGWLGLF